MFTAHRRMSQRCGKTTFLPENMCMKESKMPEFYMLFPEKYFPDLFFFWGGGQPPLPPAPVSYAVVGYDVVTTHGD